MAGSGGRRVEGSAATVSWVARQTSVGFFIKDAPPPTRLSSSHFTRPGECRCTNFLRAWVESADGRTISDWGFQADSGLYAGGSFLGIPCEKYPTLRRDRRIRQDGIEGIEFEQVAGARTISPAVIGGLVGTLCGLLVRLGIGGVAGSLVGTWLANRLMSYPPIWTRLRLRLLADGRCEISLVEHSAFPCHTLYEPGDLADFYEIKETHQALETARREWSASGWERGNPWQIRRPVFNILAKCSRLNVKFVGANGVRPQVSPYADA